MKNKFDTGNHKEYYSILFNLNVFSYQIEFFNHIFFPFVEFFFIDNHCRLDKCFTRSRKGREFVDLDAHDNNQTESNAYKYSRNHTVSFSEFVKMKGLAVLSICAFITTVYSQGIYYSLSFIYHYSDLE